MLYRRCQTKPIWSLRSGASRSRSRTCVHWAPHHGGPKRLASDTCNYRCPERTARRGKRAGDTRKAGLVQDARPSGNSSGRHDGGGVPQRLGPVAARRARWQLPPPSPRRPRGPAPPVARGRILKPFRPMLLGLDSRAARKASPVHEVEYSIQAIPSPRLRSDTITTRAPPHLPHTFATATRSGPRRGRGPARGRPPADRVAQAHVSGALSGARTGKGRRWPTHAPRRDLRFSVVVDRVHVSGARSGARTGKGRRWPTHAPRRDLRFSVGSGRSRRGGTTRPALAATAPRGR